MSTHYTATAKALHWGIAVLIFGMLGLNRLPMHHHPLFRSKVFERVTDDAFFIAIEARDPKFSPEGTRRLLEDIGGKSIELVEEED